MRRTRSEALALLSAVALLAAGCGEVVVGLDTGQRADLRLDGPVVLTRHANGDQDVSGTVVNAGDLVAADVEVTLTTFVLAVSGSLVPFETIPGVPVLDLASGTRTLRPGDRGTFAVLLPRPRPVVEEVDVEIRGRFPHGLFFFFFSPGLVIIVG